MELVKLTDICNPKQWKTISSSKLLDTGYPVYGANGRIGFYSEYTHEHPTVLITCRGATCGKININEPFSYVNGNAMALDKLRNDVDLFYLKYILEARKLDDVISGSAQPQITRTNLAKVKIPLPPLTTQKRIASILDNAAALRDKTQQLLDEYDQLVQSLFLEMFGDPILNDKNWSKKRFDELVSESCPLTYGIVQPGEDVDEGVPCVRPVDLTKQYISVDKLKKIDSLISDKFSRTILKGGEILLSVRGSVGVISIADTSLNGANVTRGIVPIWFDEKVSNKKFFYYLYKTSRIQNQVKRLARGATLIQINLKDLRELKLIQPPIVLQNQFAEKIGLIEQQKALAKQELQQSEDLFNCLLQKAFKGELV